MITLNISTAELRDIAAIERKHSAKFVSGEVHGDTATVTLYPVASTDWFVNVWNCRGTICAANDDLDDLFNYDEALAEQLIDHVVYDDNDGGINMSGQYYPQSQESLNLFTRLMQTAARKEKLAASDPTCDTCGAQMQLKSKPGFGEYWECANCRHNLQTQDQATASHK